MRLGVKPRLSGDRAVVSIPHMGTRALCERKGCGHVHTFAITYPEWPAIAARLQKMTLFSPLRDPQLTYLSWVNRWQQGSVSPRLFEVQFEYLMQFDELFSIEYVKMDAEQGKGHFERPEWIKPLPREPDWEYIYNLPPVRRFYAHPTV